MSGSYSENIRHEVFLNFRGTDTRDNFISHLYAKLKEEDVKTYIDNILAKGDEISPAPERAIEESMIYVLVFSEDYASSTWCLNELEKILECKDKYGRAVIPVFYKVDPSTVRHQRERYKEAFVKHEQRFKDKVQPWKNALNKAAAISGWDSNVIRPEYTLVAKIVEDIVTKLNRSPISDHKGVVGIEKHIEGIKSLLHLDSPSTRIIGVWGMPGIGKSTIASQIHHKFKAWNFDSSTLVLHAQKQIERDGLHRIRSEFSSFSFERSTGTKVLLIFDDMNNSDHLNHLIARHGGFGKGSRIIVTSKDMQVLKNAEADEIYKVEKMNFQDSLDLFSVHAFKQNHPLKAAYMDLSIKVLNYAKGIPLALKVLGSLLYGKERKAWESELKKLENHLEDKILNVLKLSYEGLDEEQKDIFLDITCFYRGCEESVVAQMLDCCGFSAIIGIEVLKDRGLIYVLEDKVETLGQMQSSVYSLT